MTSDNKILGYENSNAAAIRSVKSISLPLKLRLPGSQECGLKIWYQMGCAIASDTPEFSFSDHETSGSNHMNMPVILVPDALRTLTEGGNYLVKVFFLVKI